VRYCRAAHGNVWNNENIDFNGKTTTDAYDTSRRLLSKTPDASFGTAPVSFTYFPNGLRQTMADASGSTTYSYDVHNRLTQKQTTAGTMNYTYDNAGDLLTLASTNANGASATYAYELPIVRVGKRVATPWGSSWTRCSIAECLGRDCTR
jgi:hypothetical protein